jgi:hypothetical protein
MPDSITPPSELIEQWMQAHSTKYDLARHAAQWGADQELEACCESLDELNGCGYWSRRLRTARRPKPPSLKERSLQLLKTYNTSGVMLTADQADTIRRALEALDD